MNKKETKKLIQLYNSGALYKEIANELKTSRTAVTYKVAELREQGLLIDRKDRLTDLTNFIDKYNAGWSNADLAELFDRTIPSIKWYVKRLQSLGLIKHRCGLSEEQLLLLKKGYRNGLSYRRIAENIHSSLSTVSRYVNRLIEDGSLERRPPYNKDVSNIK